MKSLIVLFLLTACAHTFSSEVQTVPFVDIKSYMGKWYEIGRITHSFQRDCGATTAEYSLTKNGKVKVLNTCFNLKTNKLQEANGVASVADVDTNSKLKVSFVPLLKWLGLFSGDYWIMALDEADYQYALVGNPSREFLWILSRTPEMDQYTKEKLLDIAIENGYSLDNFKFTPTWKF